MDSTSIAIIIVLILSIVIHEVSHGYAANWLGDPTARLAGRLTLNPIKHIDPVGSVLVPALLLLSSAGILFGWAKPVPYNPYNLRNQKWGDTIVAAAGPGINILIAVIFAVIIRAAVPLGLSGSFIELSSYIVYINILLALFNLIPIPPLDGSKVLLGFLPFNAAMKYRGIMAGIERMGLLFTFLFIFLFITLFSGPFFTFVYFIFEALTGLGGL
ncbi:site-2 protease family protein [Candidatus Parcubacteria bacterium]|nr:site-2 protease family protein [Candidatus Parcubacteria bacterium]